MAEKCKFQDKITGKQCGAYRMENSEYCFCHNPEVPEEEKKLARARGGRGKGLSFKILPEKELKKPQQVSEMLEEIINLVRMGEISDKKATLLRALSDSLLKSLELGELDERLNDLEDYTKTNL